MRSRATDALPPSARQALERLGRGVARARGLRGIRQVDLAAQALISPQTLADLERGLPGVRLGTLVSVLHVLGLDHALAEIAARDPAIDHLPFGPVRRKRVRPQRGSTSDDDF